VGNGAKEIRKVQFKTFLIVRCPREWPAAERYEVLRTSLQDRVKVVEQGQLIILKPILGSFQQTFTTEYERRPCQHDIDLDNRLMPLTRSVFLRFA
jgi:hypothetical protein